MSPLIAAARERAGVYSALLPRRFFVSAGWGMADQGLISVANFLLILLLARELSRNAFGEFVLVWTGLQLFLSFQGALITQPHNVLGVRHEGEDYRAYTSTCLAFQAVFAGVSALAFCALAAVALLWTESASRLLLLLAITAPAWQAQEFFRRVMYTERRPKSAFINDLLGFGGQGIALVLLMLSGNLTAELALFAVFLTSLGAAVLGLYQVRASLSRRVGRAFLKENWLYSRWLVGATASGWGAGQFHRYIVAIMGGASATATLAAVELLFRPVGVLVASMDTMLPTYLVRQISAHRVLSHFRVYAPILLTAPFVVAYVALVAILGNRLLNIVYGETYSDELPLILLMSVVVLMHYVASFAGATLRAINATHIIFINSIIGCSVTLTLGWLLVGAFSTEGAPLTMILNSSIVLAVAMYKIRRELAS